MKKVCFFSGDITRSGGTEKVGCQIASALADIYSVSVISLTESGDKLFYPLNSAVKHEALFEHKVSGIKDYFHIVNRLKKYLKNNDIDIIIDIDGILDLFSLSACIFNKVKVLSWEHFNFHETLGSRFRIPIRRMAARYADCIITLTKEDKDYYIQNLKIKNKIVQIYNPIEAEPGYISYDSKSKTIVSAGRLTYQKGFDLLVDVAAIVMKKYPDWEWVILGEGDERVNLEKKILQYNLPEKVKLLGRVSNVNEYLRHSSFYVMTSRFEGFPLALTEAKANKLPVVSFKCRTGPVEMVQDGVNGYLVDCFDIEKMAARICDLIDDENKRIAFSNKALVDTEKLDKDFIIRQWAELINSL